MGYSISREVLESRRHLLVELELGRACRWHTTPSIDETKRLMYQLREALYIASLYPEEYPALAQARKQFSLWAIKPGLIEAKPKGSDAAPTIHLRDRDPVPVHGLAPFGREQSTVGKTTAAEVVEAWDAHAPSLDPIHCQQTSLPLDELRKLYDWAVRHQPRLMLLVGEGFLTVSLRDTEMDGYAWTPPTPATEPEPEYNV